MKNLLKMRPKLSVKHARKLDDQVAKTEVSIVAYAILLGGMVLVQILFGPDDVIEDKS